MAITNTPDPFPVIAPKPSIESVKMLGNMMELNKPIATMVHTATEPKLSIVAITSRNAVNAAMPSSVPVRIFCSRPEPINRPIIAPPQ